MLRWDGSIAPFSEIWEKAFRWESQLLRLNRTTIWLASFRSSWIPYFSLSDPITKPCRAGPPDRFSGNTWCQDCWLGIRYNRFRKKHLEYARWNIHGPHLSSRLAFEYSTSLPWSSIQRPSDWSRNVACHRRYSLDVREDKLCSSHAFLEWMTSLASSRLDFFLLLNVSVVVMFESLTGLYW